MPEIADAVIVLFTLLLFYAINKYPKLFLTKLRSKSRSTARTHKHFVTAAQLLTRARSVKNKGESYKLANDAVLEAEKSLLIDDTDAAMYVLKGLGLDLMGKKADAIRCLDAAMMPPARGLGEKERGDALIKRAEIVAEMNRRKIVAGE